MATSRRAFLKGAAVTAAVAAGTAIVTAAEAQTFNRNAAATAAAGGETVLFNTPIDEGKIADHAPPAAPAAASQSKTQKAEGAGASVLHSATGMLGAWGGRGAAAKTQQAEKTTQAVQTTDRTITTASGAKIDPKTKNMKAGTEIWLAKDVLSPQTEKGKRVLFLMIDPATAESIRTRLKDAKDLAIVNVNPADDKNGYLADIKEPVGRLFAAGKPVTTVKVDADNSFTLANLTEPNFLEGGFGVVAKPKSASPSPKP